MMRLLNELLKCMSIGSHVESRTSQHGKNTEEGRGRYDIFEKCRLKAPGNRHVHTIFSNFNISVNNQYWNHCVVGSLTTSDISQNRRSGGSTTCGWNASSI